MSALTFGKVNAIRWINVRFPSEADFQEATFAVAECELHVWILNVCRHCFPGRRSAAGATYGTDQSIPRSGGMRHLPYKQPSTRSLCRPNKRIQRRCNPLASLKQEGLVAFHFQQRCLNRDALCCERWLAKLVHQRGQVNRRGLVADRAIRLAADEGQIGDVIRLAGSEASLQYGFGKDVMLSLIHI